MQACSSYGVGGCRPARGVYAAHTDTKSTTHRQCGEGGGFGSVKSDSGLVLFSSKNIEVIYV